MDHAIIEDIKLQIKSNNPVTRLIVLNIGVFLFLTLLKIFFNVANGVGLPAVIYSFFYENLALPMSFGAVVLKPWTFITYMFTHVGFFHLFGNMIALYWFGQLLCTYSSDQKIIPVYLMGGVGGALLALIFVSSGGFMIGASAGVTAVVVATAMLIPYHKMNLMFFGPVKLYYIAAFFVLMSIVNASAYTNVGGNLSHIGGAIMGYVFMAQYKRGVDYSIRINAFLNWFVMFFRLKEKPKLKTVHKRPVSDQEYNASVNANQAEVDAILDKIAKSGYDSLSKQDKELLFKASNN